MSSHRKTQFIRRQDTRILLARSQMKDIKSKNSAVDLTGQRQVLASCLLFHFIFQKDKYATYIWDLTFNGKV